MLRYSDGLECGGSRWFYPHLQLFDSFEDKVENPVCNLDFEEDKVEE